MNPEIIHNDLTNIIIAIWFIYAAIIAAIVGTIITIRKK